MAEEILRQWLDNDEGLYSRYHGATTAGELESLLKDDLQQLKSALVGSLASPVAEMLQDIFDELDYEELARDFLDNEPDEE